MSDFTFTATHGQTIERPDPLYRHGDKLLPTTPPEGEYVEGQMWPEGIRICEVIGISPVYDAPNHKAAGTHKEVVIEFIVTNSRQYSGLRARGWFSIPKAWDNELAKLGNLARAMLGRQLEDGEAVDFKALILARKKIQVEFEKKMSQGGRGYMKPVTFTAYQDSDDFVADSTAAAPAEEYPMIVPDEEPDYVDEIPF